MKLRKSIAVLSAALAVSAVTALPISAQVITPVQSDASTKTYEINFDTLKSLMFKCGLDYTVNADEENGVITYTSKDGYETGILVTFKKGDIVKAVSENSGTDDAEVIYCVTVGTEVDE